MSSTAQEREMNDRFEEDVRIIAKHLFPGPSTSRGRIFLNRERDGIFDDGETFHVFEATVSRRQQKVEEDISKSAALVAQLRRDNPEYNVKIWIVTEQPPTADQDAAARTGRKKARCPVEVLSYSELYNRLFDARQLLEARKNYPFGSIRNPFDNSYEVPDSTYVSVGFTRQADGTGVGPPEVSASFNRGGYRGALLGDFGAGKSMALRHMYIAASEDFRAGRVRRFPIYLNLRDHYGQSDPAEALMRHATKVGVDFNRLIAAWRAGFADLFLDGFDELSPAQFATEVRNLRTARRAAAELVANFVAEANRKSSILITGRRHYFDSLAEMRSALGLSEDAEVLNVGEFTDEQIKIYLDQHGLTSSMPVWLPRRPLLIGYLAASGMLQKVWEKENDSPSEGWDFLLTQICEREIRQVSGAAVEWDTLRLLLEHLATFARALEGGRGPISASHIISAYERILGHPADVRTQTLLLRLPGLATVPGQEEAREFLDDDFVDACRAGDARRFLQFPFDESYEFGNVQVEGGAVLIDFLRSDLKIMSERQASAALLQASFRGFDIFGLDLVKAMSIAGTKFVEGKAYVRNAYIKDLDIYSDVDLSGVEFQDCWIENLDVAYAEKEIVSGHLPVFRDCVIENLSGLTREGDMPKELLKGSSSIEHFVGIASTNAELLTSDELPLSVAVLLTILKKAFFQAGGGRQEAAFYRGLDHRAKAYVPEVIKVLERHDFLEKSGRGGAPIWLARKDKLSEAKSMRDAPLRSQHPVLDAVRSLSN